MDWTDLDRELAAWRDAGRIATFWWRDDDAAAPSPALERLLRLSGAATPVALAVIPADTGPALAAALRGRPAVTVLQHGYAHRNHAPPGVKKAEFGPHRPARDMEAELARGRDRLAALFGDGFRPVLVPPWNRIDPALARTLPRLGYAGLSIFGGASRLFAGSDMVVADTHVDIVGWRNGRGFVGAAAALRSTVRHLAARRSRDLDGDEPTGLLTHHRVQDPAGWAFVEAFLDRVATDRAARWLDPAALFAPGDPARGTGRNQSTAKRQAWNS